MDLLFIIPILTAIEVVMDIVLHYLQLCQHRKTNENLNSWRKESKPNLSDFEV
jgi:hypothetical protein